MLTPDTILGWRLRIHCNDHIAHDGRALTGGCYHATASAPRSAPHVWLSLLSRHPAQLVSSSAPVTHATVVHAHYVQLSAEGDNNMHGQQH